MSLVGLPYAVKAEDKGITNISQRTSFAQADGRRSLQSQIARLRADLQICDDNIRQLATSVKQLRRDNRNLKKRLSRMREGLVDVEKQLAELRKALSEERQNRKKAMKEITESLSREINRTLESVEQTNAQQSPEQNIQGTYTVSTGDTLSMIGAAYGVSAQKIRELNDLEDDTIYPGQELLIPEKSSE